MIRTCDCLDKQFHALANDIGLKIIGLLRDYPLNEESPCPASAVLYPYREQRPCHGI